jgi:glycine hydroxymethyltransferase
MKEAEFEIIANSIANILDNINDTKLQQDTKAKLTELAKQFVIYDRPTY